MADNSENFNRSDYLDISYLDECYDVNQCEFDDYDTAHQKSSASSKPAKPAISHKKAKKCSPKKKKFTIEEKKKLAKAVEEHTAIWDLTDKHHSNTNATCKAWSEISTALSKEEIECRRTWKSMKDSLRYIENKKKKLKSGSAADDGPIDFNEEKDDDEFDWDLANEMSFASPTLTKRKTISSSDPTGSLDSLSNYSYAESNSSKKKKSEDDQILSAFQGISNALQNISSSTNAPAPERPKYKYEQMLSNIDWMLQQVPEDRIPHLNCKIINLITEEIKKN